MSFVIDAGGIDTWLFFSNNIVPVRLSIKIADLALRDGSAERDIAVTSTKIIIKDFILADSKFFIFKVLIPD
jgi:hypothetical protein